MSKAMKGHTAGELLNKLDQKISNVDAIAPIKTKMTLSCQKLHGETL